MTFKNIPKIKNEKTRSIVNALFLITCCYLIQVVFTISALVFSHYVLNDDFINLYAFIFVAYLMEIPVIIYFIKKWNLNLMQEIKPISFGVSLILLLTSLIIFLFNPVISEPVSYFENLMNGKIPVFIPRKIEVDYLFILTFFSYVIVAPIIEEIVYRGIVFNYLKRTFNLVPAIIISSFLFALFHFDFSGEGVIKLISGFAFCIAYHKTKSIVAPILFHIFINLISQLTTEQVIEASAVNISRYIPLVIFGIFFTFFLIKEMVKKVETPESTIEDEKE